MSTPIKTAHQLARELLEGPDLPIWHYDPFLPGDGITAPQLEEVLSEPKERKAWESFHNPDVDKKLLIVGTRRTDLPRGTLSEFQRGVKALIKDVALCEAPLVSTPEDLSDEVFKNEAKASQTTVGQ